MGSLEQIAFTPEDLRHLNVEAELGEEESPVRAPISSCAELDLASLTNAPLNVDVSALVDNRSTRGGSSGS